MSIILKGIDLPKKGEYLNISINNSGEVTLVHLISLEKTDAKAIQIPKRHGDIKDVGKLEDELDSRCGQLSAEIVRNAPTILEEEK